MCSMKKIILFTTWMIIAQLVQAQILAEWTQQTKTQIRYLVEQIGAFQSYLGYVKKGYDVAHKGLAVIENIKNGDWTLHKDFIGSLKAVNPAISKYSRVADIKAMQVRIVKESRSLLSECKKSGRFNLAETDYLQSICNHLLIECLKSIDELVMIITPGELAMRDDERIKRIEKIYADMQDKQTFMASFGRRTILLSRQREHEQNEILLSEKLNGLQ